jgi:tetratricopeptide (TPR) repeat protein
MMQEKLDMRWLRTTLMGACMLVSQSGCRILNQNDTNVHMIDMAERDLASQKLVEKGNIHVAKNQFPKAESYFQQAIQLDSQNGPAHNNLGLVYFYQHNFYQAAGAFEKASEYLPEDPAPLNNLGLIMEMVARPDEAIDYYWQAHSIDPTNPEYLGNLVRARVQAKHCDDELRQQLHDLLLYEKRLPWQDWAREQLALFNNPNLDNGPPPPSVDDLNAIGKKGQTKETGSRLLSPSPSSRVDKNPGNSSELIIPTPLPSPSSSYKSNSQPIPRPIPLPDPIPNEIMQRLPMDSVLERLE